MKTYTAADHEQYRKAQDEKAAKAEQERREHVEKANARQAWIRDGGRVEDFEEAWPGLRDAARKQRVVDADRRAREMMRNGTTSRI